MVTDPFQQLNQEMEIAVQEAEARLRAIMDMQEWLEQNIDLLIEAEEEDEIEGIDWEEEIVEMKTPPPSNQ